MTEHDDKQDLLGETLAKFEFFEHGWNPYNRFLDVDNVDIILRRRSGIAAPAYREVLVKFSWLHDPSSPSEQRLFDASATRAFLDGELDEALPHLFVVYVLSRQGEHGQSKYKGDVFVFPMRIFNDILRKAPLIANGRRQVHFSREKDGERWFLHRTRGNLEKITEDTALDITQYRRAFALLDG